MIFCLSFIRLHESDLNWCLCKNISEVQFTGMPSAAARTHNTSTLKRRHELCSAGTKAHFNISQKASISWEIVASRSSEHKPNSLDPVLHFASVPKEVDFGSLFWFREEVDLCRVKVLPESHLHRGCETVSRSLCEAALSLHTSERQPQLPN